MTTPGNADSARAATPGVRVDLVAQWLGLSGLLAYLVSPLLWQAWLAGPESWGDPAFLFNAGTTLLWFVFAHAALRRPFWLHLALSPLYVTTAVDLFLLANFGARLSSGYVSIALTDHADTRDFLSTYARPVAAAALTLLVFYLPGLYAIKGLRKRRSPRLAILAAVALLGLYGFGVGRDLHNGTTVERAVLDVADHENSAPMGAVFQAALALRLNAVNAEFQTHRAGYSFGATRTASSGEEIYVWVIGESARPNDWSLFGYKRDTNPRLRTIDGIVRFPNMLTTAPHTSVAVPSMLSLRPITDWPSILSQPSIVEAFNEVGFKTYWLSAQSADSWSGVVPQMAAEATQRRYFEQGHDGALLPQLQEILDSAPRGSKLFIVLHTKGSHFDYARRYPDKFARFNTPGGTRREHLVDAYDNSILYTDWFLSQVIGMVSRRSSRAALIYASDHGENLLDDNRGLLGHALGTPYDLHSAAFAWFSEGMRHSHAEQIANARRNAHAPLSLSNLPHSMLDLAGIYAKGLDSRTSVFSSSFAEQPRSYIVRGELRHEARDAAPLP